jgi:hypothetical protein
VIGTGRRRRRSRDAQRLSLIIVRSARNNGHWPLEFRKSFANDRPPDSWAERANHSSSISYSTPKLWISINWFARGTSTGLDYRPLSVMIAILERSWAERSASKLLQRKPETAIHGIVSLN